MEKKRKYKISGIRRKKKKKIERIRRNHLNWKKTKKKKKKYSLSMKNNLIYNVVKVSWLAGLDLVRLYANKYVNSFRALI